MTPSPEIAVQGRILVNEEVRKYRDNRRKRLGPKLERYGVDPSLFSDEYLIKEVPSGGRIIGRLIIPVLQDNRTSWYSVLRKAIGLKVEGDNTLGNIVNLFGIKEISEENKILREAKLSLGKGGKLLTIHLPRWLTEDQKISDLAAIAMVPGEVLEKHKEIVLVYPCDIGKRFILLNLRGDRSDNVYIAEFNGSDIEFSKCRFYVLEFGYLC